MDQAQHHFASVDADADLGCWPAGQLASTPAKRITHRECGVYRALGMVLVRDRRPEQRKDAIAG
jgi:hypothetical protein